MSLSPAARLLSDYVVRSFAEGDVPTEAQLKERMEMLAPVVAAIGKSSTTEAERAAVMNELLARLRVSMDTGTSLKEADVKPWLDSRRSSIDPFYWTRFRNYLERDWSPGVLRTFDRVTDEILDLCGNPAEDEISWSRRSPSTWVRADGWRRD